MKKWVNYMPGKGENSHFVNLLLLLLVPVQLAYDPTNIDYVNNVFLGKQKNSLSRYILIGICMCM